MNNYNHIKEDTLIIKASDNDLIGNLIKQRKYNIENMYRGNNNIFFRFLRRLFINYRLPFYKVWFNKKIITYKVKNIIIFESLLSSLLVKWINDNIQVNIHVWYWNIVRNTIRPDLLNFKNCKLWTFSREDAKTYNMNFNPPPYFSEILCNTKHKIYDVVFVGKDKGRLKQLLYWKEQLETKKLKTLFHITPNRTYNVNKNYSKPIPYHESLKLSCVSKAVFDYIEIDNSGQSMRMMESLFLSNKIITNNRLIKDYDFYNSNNIFILNEDDFDKINEFLDKEYTPIDNHIINNYDFDEFFLRFFVDRKCWWNVIIKDNVDEN